MKTKNKLCHGILWLTKQMSESMLKACYKTQMVYRVKEKLTNTSQLRKLLPKISVKFYTKLLNEKIKIKSMKHSLQALTEKDFK